MRKFNENAPNMWMFTHIFYFVEKKNKLNETKGAGGGRTNRFTNENQSETNYQREFSKQFLFLCCLLLLLLL